jgi:hypothetical protein
MCVSYEDRCCQLDSDRERLLAEANHLRYSPAMAITYRHFALNDRLSAQKYHDILIDVAVITASWLLLIIIMLCLQGLGYDFGFRVWPIGEVRNWLMFLHDRPGVGAAKLFWSVDSRNPLSPWWYLAARPLIQHQDSAFLILHLAVGLLTGLSAYILLRDVIPGRGRLFAVSLGMLVSQFITTVYRDDIVWISIAALSCNLLTMWTFLRSKATEKHAAWWRSLSLVFWLVAISTYSLQCGALLGIAVLSFVRNITGSRLGHKAIIRSVLIATIELGPYIAVFVIYNMIWLTTSAPFSSDLKFSFDQMLRSLSIGLWHTDYGIFWDWANESGIIFDTAVFAVTAIAMFSFFHFVRDYKFGLQWRHMPVILVIGISVVGPTVALESSSDIFYPGTRFRMVTQFWVPFLFCVTLALTLMVLPLKELMRTRIWQAGIALAGGAAVVLVLGFNRTQVIYTRAETHFFDDLKAIVARDRNSGSTFPRYYLIRLDASKPYFYGSNIETAYTRTVLDSDVRFRTAPPPPSYYEGPAISFQTDGVVLGNDPPIPYKQVSLLAWNGLSLVEVPMIDEEAAKRLRARWAR